MVAAETKAGIRVCARFRPQNKLEQQQQAVECVHVDVDGTTVRIDKAGSADNAHTFTFDQVFGTDASQADVYNATAGPLVESALRGYNCTCFVYGQTGTGKTFSMEGVPGDAEYAGIIPRVMDDIFDGIQNMQQDLEFLVRVSYVEIYLEKIRDLLEPKSTNLTVRESKDRGVWIQGATEICCASAAEMLAVMRLGGANRVISSTRMNNDSSRSHSVFIITIEQRNVATGSLKSGKLFLVDLAGSEKVGKTQAKGQTLKEAQHINKSLSALGSVMNALTSGQPNAHIPYRDSKLTRLLQDSLGGNSETTLLVCGSCSSYNCEETVSTLRFGTRAKNIKNKPKVNEERTVAEYKILVAAKDKEIAALQAQIQQYSGAESSSTGSPGPNDVQVQELLAKIEQLEDEQASKAAETVSLEERCAELELKAKHFEEKELKMASMTNRNDDFVRKLTFLENELTAKAKECDDLNKMLEKLKVTKTVAKSISTPISEVAPLSDSQSDDAGRQSQNSDQNRNSDGNITRNRADSSVLFDNELLRHQLGAKVHEVELCTKRIAELTEELVNCRNFYEEQVSILQQRLHEYDSHVRGFMEIAENEDKSAQVESLKQKTKMLRAVRGGGGVALPRRSIGGVDPFTAASAISAQRPRIVSSDPSQDGWEVDDEVFPIAPIDMDSPVVKRLIASMPEKGREKISKWLVFVLEGRDIRSNFHPELSIEGVNEDINRDMRRLIIPLLKNRHDLEVQSFVRTRFVRVSDLKITLAPKNPETVHVEATNVGDDDACEDGKSTITSVPTSANTTSKTWAKDHVFYGPKSDPSSPLVLHGIRTLLPSKDRFTSEPVDLSASVTESKTILEVSPSAPSSGTSVDPPTSGGVFGRLRSKTSAGLLSKGSVLGDVKTLINARYHKNHVHEDTLCDGCGMSPIVGGKWKCSTCDSFELCDTCYAAGVHGFEVSNEMCRRIEQAAVHKYRALADYPELFELFRRHICGDDVAQFRRIVEWLLNIVAGVHASNIQHKMIVKSGLHPEIRSRLVAQLGALASERQDIVLKTEWFVEKTHEEEDETEIHGEEDGDGNDKPSRGQRIVTVVTPPSSPRVRLETLRMYVTDATIEEQVNAVRTLSFRDLLSDQERMTGTATTTTNSTVSSSAIDDIGAIPIDEHGDANGSTDSPNGDHSPALKTQQTLDSKPIKSITSVDM